MEDMLDNDIKKKVSINSMNVSLILVLQSCFAVGLGRIVPILQFCEQTQCFNSIIINTPFSISWCKYFQRHIKWQKTVVCFHFTANQSPRAQGETRDRKQIYLLIEINWENSLFPQKDFMKTRHFY